MRHANWTFLDLMQGTKCHQGKIAQTKGKYLMNFDEEIVICKTDISASAKML
jgi:hypothetical protein